MVTFKLREGLSGFDMQLSHQCCWQGCPNRTTVAHGSDCPSKLFRVGLESQMLHCFFSAEPCRSEELSFWGSCFSKGAVMLNELSQSHLQAAFGDVHPEHLGC